MMYNSSYTQRLASSLVGNLNEGVNNNIFVKHYSEVIISKEEITQIAGNDIKVLFHEFNPNIIQGAYAPLLEWIKLLYKEEFSETQSAEDFIDSCGIYSLHKSIFYSYISDGICKRQEPIIFPEVSYENCRFLQSMISIFEHISNKKKIIVILTKLNYANDSFLRFLDKYLSGNMNNRVCILAFFNDINEQLLCDRATWNSLIKNINDQNSLFDMENTEYPNNSGNMPMLKFEASRLDEYAIMFKNMFYTMAYRQTVFYESIIHEELLKVANDSYLLPVCSIMIHAAASALYNDDIDKCLELTNNINTFIRPDSNDIMALEFNFLQTMINMYYQRKDEAISFAGRAIEVACRHKNEQEIFDANVMYYKSYYCGWYDMFHKKVFSSDINVTKINIPCDFIGNLVRHNYYNTLAYFYIYAFDNDEESMSRIAESLAITGFFKDALEIAYRLDNMCFVASAYMKKIFDYSVDDCRYHEYISFLHKRRNDIVKKQKFFSLDEYRYDNLGYQCIIHERYELAHAYFNDYLVWVYKQNRVNDMAETLYNIATNSMAAGDFNNACKYLLITIKIIEYMQVQSLCVCKASKIYGMLALCYYYMDEEINCALYVDKIERMVSHLLDTENEADYFTWDDELFLYYFLKALLHKKNDNIGAAQLCFSKAEYHMFRSREYMFFSYPLYAYEKADMYYLLGESKKADAIIDKCIEFCSRNGYAKRAMKLSNKKNNNISFIEQFNFEISDITSSQILELARRSEIVVKRVARQKDISFLSDWQDILNREVSSSEQVINDAMSALKKMYMFDGMMYFTIENGKPKMIYCNEEAENAVGNINKIYDFFKICDNVFSTTRSEKVFLEYKPVIQYFDMSKIMVFVGIPLIDNEEISNVFVGYSNTNDLYGYNDNMVDDNELEVIKFVLIQLNIGIKKIKRRKDLEKINQKLYELAVKDQLTGLFNRQGFDRRLDEIYENKRKLDIMLMYLDLDNFKYYNDTFGHDVGDVVLKKFAKVLSDSVDIEDIVVRYGGDEFIIFMRSCDEDKANYIASKIAKELGSGFIEDIREKCGEYVDIPPNKMLSCSIGISYKKACKKEDINEILLKADEALYYIKDNMKGTCISWDDLHEQK